MLRQVPVVRFAELQRKSNLSSTIQAAFGKDGIGILAVSHVPGMETLRSQLLPMAHAFAHLPREIQQKYELKEAYYSFGWSHGKEKLQGRPDFAKGSYYNNPQYDHPIHDPTLIERYPAFLHPNIWPTEMPQLRTAFMALGQLIVDCGLLVAHQCDVFVQSQCPTYPPHHLYNTIAASRSCKARLLHYFEVQPDALNAKEDDAMEFSNWCGWHNDHGSLTGLVPALFMENDNVVENPDPKSGLYVKARNGEIARAVCPPGHLIYQIGESAQIHSGGLLQATPHAVRGPRCPHVSRETFAVFMEPDWHIRMAVPEGMEIEGAGETEHLPHGVPALKSRWNNAMDFAQFTQATHSAYY